MSATDSTTRFSSRVKDYVLYRPGYPNAIIDFLAKGYGLVPSSIIADIGSGTGKLTEMFLQNGNRVYALEPNKDMRLAAENLLKDHPGFISMDARAEDTGMPDKSVDFIIAGQAFHWFKVAEAKKEFKRILKPNGYVALIWNERELNQDGFMGEYDEFLNKYSTDYKEIDHRNVDANKIAAFFSPGIYQLQKFDNHQEFSFEGLKGRYDSSSYAIPATDPGYKDAIEKLADLFKKHEQNGMVFMKYVTKVFCGNFGD